ncbi:FitA-like ribbon-helix-helix domain-containing protein [Pseudomonas mohnii]|uniref:FitA-like ribbon-helix-helix domain-containing protein n=1 Tax=Pseudomonas sp. MIL9 TaxID=2807620 RepID=UPI001028EE76|nr:plasmid stabilization protein [Pseudomonas sp. MIL9]MBM6443036.1 plasmid stabilization protein [Pseudomonas sp. MIL9]RZO00389.1 plasmid stabilization protein [Pseudomonas moorei]
MASITIRNLDDQIKEQLRIAAAHNGHSMEEEARLILGRALATIDRAGGLGSRIRDRFRVCGGVELDLPERQEKASAVDFSE